MEGNKEYKVRTRNRFIGLIGLCLILAASTVFFLWLSNNLSKDLVICRGDLDQLKAEIAALTEYVYITPSDIEQRTQDISVCVEPLKPMIRDIAASAVANTPSGIKSYSETWKIWKINYWVYHNIHYVEDPKGKEYYALASETLLVKAGDCDDFAILLASMYESVGLDAAIMKVDTKGDYKPDHMGCLVYYSKDADSYLGEEERILQRMMIKSPTDKLHVRYKEVPISSLHKYDSGIWILIDPTVGRVKDLAGYITQEPYNVVSVIDVGD